MDDRRLSKGVPLTPAQQAQVNAALGGDMSRILNMTTQDLEQLGLGFLVNRPAQAVPGIQYVEKGSHKIGVAFVQLKCVF